MQKLIYQNGDGSQIDLTADPYGITDWSGLSEVSLDVQSQQVPFHDGAVYLDGLIQERTVSVTLAINDGGDLEKRYEYKRKLIKALNPKNGEGVLIYTNDYLSKQIGAVPDVPTFKNKNANDSGTLKASLSFTCCSPFWEDTEETQVILDKNSYLEIENGGDVETSVKMTVSADSVTDPVITNETTGKKIAVQGTYTSPVNINTGFGTKSVEKTEMSIGEIKPNRANIDGFEINGKCFINPSCYTEDGKTFTHITAQYTFTKYVNAFNKIYGEKKTDTLYTSSDGITWEAVYTADAIITDILYSEELGKLVLVLANGSVVYTSDGVTWNVSATGSSGNNYMKISVLKESSKIVIWERGSTCYTSSDFVTWETISTGLSGNYVTSVGSNIYTFLTVIGACLYSKDLTNWTLLFSGNLEAFYIKQYGYFIMATNLGIYYLKETDLELIQILDVNSVGKNIFFSNVYKNILLLLDTNLTSNTSNKIYIMDADTNITLMFFPFDNFYFPFSYERNGKIITYYDKMYTSEGVDKYFKAESLGLNSKYFKNGIICEDEKDLIFSIGGKFCKTSDGENWETIDFPTDINTCAITYGAGKYLAVMFTSSSTYKICYSEDLTEWTKCTYSTELSAPCNIVYCDSLGLFVTVDGSTLYYSSDGVNFSENNLLFTVNSGAFLFWNKYRKELVIHDGLNNYISEDGIYFNQIFSTCAVTFNDPNNLMVYNPNLDLYFDVYGAYLYYTNNFKEWKAVSIYDGGVNKSLVNYQGKTYVWGPITLSIDFNETNNIENLTEDSDMTFALAEGSNKLSLNVSDGDAEVVVTYRQKYLGV